MGVWVTGDTHGIYDLHKVLLWNKINKNTLTEEDVLIIAGDFGFIWNGSKKEQRIIDLNLGHLKCTLCFVDGNHENFELLEQLPQVNKFGNVVGQINDKIFHLKRGNVYTIQGKTFFTFGGGYSLDKSRRQEFISWWSQEMPSKAEYDKGLRTLREEGDKVDYIITHTCPDSLFDEFSKIYEMSHKVVSAEQPIRDYFEILKESVSFEKWFFGHFHIDWHSKEDARFFALYQKIVKIL